MPAPGMYGERYEQRIARAVAFVDSNLHDVLTLESLASVACLSPFHFHRVFHEVTGESVRAFVERRRLERALSLAQAGVRWRDAAPRCGFASANSFSRAFKRVYGVSPSQFDLAAWWRSRPDREQAQSLSAFFLRPPPPPDPTFVVTLRERPAVRLARARVWGGYLHPARMAAAYSRIVGWARRQGLQVDNGALAGASRDDPDLTPLAKCRYDFTLEIPDDVPLPSMLSEDHRPAGWWAITHVDGDMPDVDRAWSQLFKQWLPASGLDLRDAPVEERYLTLPEASSWTRFDLECAVPIVRPAASTSSPDAL